MFFDFSRLFANSRSLFVKNIFHDRRSWYIAVFLATIMVGSVFLNSPQREFPTRSIIVIEEGEPLARISRLLKEEHLIRSQLWFETMVIIRGGERRVMAGDYFFIKPVGAFSVAKRLTNGLYGVTPIRVTVPEGLTLRETAATLKEHITTFDDDAFLNLAKEHEGYLFPDTYFFLPNTSPETVLEVMRANFDKKKAPLKEKIEQFGKSLHEIVIMASIIEREVRVPEDRRIVSGILWKRIEIGMPLQVDAAFIYVNGTTTPGLSLEDLKIDSPYNTYLNRGLPIGPIGNPGLDAIEAALEPTTTPYLYYLSDSAGVTHYARTFDEHRENKAKYLR